MMKNRGVWFVVGFAVGFLALYAALSWVPHFGPAMVEADEAQVTPYGGAQQESLAELGRLARRANRWVDEYEKNRTSGGNDAREAALKSDLQTIRSQIELYRIQHHDRHPGLDENGKLDMSNFTRRLTSKTDPSGALNSNGQMGPYLQRFPKNPFWGGNGPDQVTWDGAKSGTSVTGGWYFNTTTGKFHANDPDHRDL